MKALNILGAGLSAILTGLSFYYIDEVHFLRWRNSFTYDGYSSANYAHEPLTVEVGIITLIFFIGIGYLFLKNLKSSKIISIIGFVASLVMLAWDILMISSPSHISFDEAGYAWMGYSIISIILFILLWKQYIPENELSKDIIDDLDI